MICAKRHTRNARSLLGYHLAGNGPLRRRCFACSVTDNGKPNDSILMHILSPYPAHRSALTDCEKLTNSTLGEAKAVLVYGYDDDAWPLEAAIDALETLASIRHKLGTRQSASFDGLVHPIHTRGAVYAWREGHIKPLVAPEARD